MEKNMILQEFGRIVRKKRKGKNLSQEALADLAGLHRTYIGMIERGEKNVTLTNIKKIAKALDCSMSELVKNL